MIQTQRLSILYFDDDVPCLHIFEQMFGDKYEVYTAFTLADARRALSERTFDIVLSDYAMPEIDGTAFLQEVATAHPNSYRVMLTGALQVGNVIYELGKGVIHLFLKKPWNEGDMQKALEKAAATRAVRMP